MRSEGIDKIKMGKIFYIMGKSASGKDRIYSSLIKKSELALKRLVLYTTRPIRSGEENGREYFFVTDSEFFEMEKKGCIIEKKNTLPWKESGDILQQTTDR